MNKNLEYVNRYVDSLSENEAKETLKKILSERYTIEKKDILSGIHKQVAAMYIKENRDESSIEVPKINI